MFNMFSLSNKNAANPVPNAEVTSENKDLTKSTPTKLTIAGRFFKDENTLVLDSISNGGASVNFSNGTLVTRGDESTANVDQLLLQSLGTTPVIVSKGSPGIIDPNSPTTTATTTTTPPALSSTGVQKGSSTPVTSNATPNTAASSTSPGEIELKEFEKTPYQPKTSLSSIDKNAANSSSNVKGNDNIFSSITDKQLGGTRSFRVRKQKTYNKRNYRKSRKSRRYRK